MKVDWSKINKWYFVFWYLLTISIMMVVGYIFNFHIIATLIAGHIAFSIFAVEGLIDYILENRIIETKE